MLSPEAGLSPVHCAAKTKDRVSSMYREIATFGCLWFPRGYAQVKGRCFLSGDA